MALTITGVYVGVIGDIRYRVVDVAFDASYDSGGEPLTASMLGFDTIFYLRAKNTSGYLIKYDYINYVLKAFVLGIGATTGDDIVSGLNNTIVKNANGNGIEVSGNGTAFQAALSEVTATTNLVTPLSSVRLLVLGK